MKITKLETINFTQGIQVHAGAVIRKLLAEVLLGRDPRQIDRLWADMLLKVGYHGWAGSEMRTISAVDIALWDLLGKYTGQPVYQLLGGKSRDQIRTYNTCYDNLYDFNEEAGKLAQDLLKMGIQAMKIWP